jgi:signal transduction histidine kinase
MNALPAEPRPKILCVDDEPSILNVLNRGLSGHFEVHTAPGGNTAIEAMRREPDLVVIISDQKMPGMSGIEVFEAAQKIVPDAIRIMLTAYSDLGLILDAINRGHIYQFLLKPFEMETMQVTVQRACEYYYQKKELERTYRDLLAAREHLLKSERMSLLGRLMSGITHELGNPISNILQATVLASHEWSLLKSFIERVREVPAGESVRVLHQELFPDGSGQAVSDFEHILRTIQNSTEYVKEIIQNLKNFSRLDEDEWRAVRVSEVMDQAIRLLYPRSPFGIRIHKTYGDDPFIQALYGPLVQVMVHVIHFAAQSIDREGDIWLRTWREDDHVAASVRYNGTPVPSSRRDHLFEIDQEGGHVHIGLMIAHDIIERHGGTIRVDSPGSQETEFIVTLPVDRAELGAP